jgi:hypothetical protein
MLRSIVHAQNSYPLSSKRGGSLWGKIKSFAGVANKFLRRTHLLSTVGSLASPFIPQLRIPTMAAHIAGYGRMRPRGVFIRNVKKGYGRRRRR